MSEYAERLNDLGYDPGDGLPYRIPGERQFGLRRQLLSSGEFSYGLELLEGTVTIPRSTQWHQMYFDLVKYEITPADWNRAVTETVRTGNDGKSRMPSPEAMIARANAGAGRGANRFQQEMNAHAGRWIFRCSDCGYRRLTLANDLDRAPTRCTECEERMTWVDRAAVDTQGGRD